MQFWQPNWQKIKVIFFLAILWRVVLQVFALLAPKLAVYRPSFPYYQWLMDSQLLPSIYSWANFDGVHYLTIARSGYKAAALIAAFFPLYPNILSSYNLLNLPLIPFSIGLSTGLSLLSILSVYFLFEAELDKRAAKLAWLLFLIFPTAFFLTAVYSESIFIIWLSWCLYFAKKRKWWLAGLFGALAANTRLVGIFLLPAMLVEVWQSYHPDFKAVFKNLASWWPILLISLGTLVYCAYLKYEFNDPLYFFHVQSEFGGGRQESLVVYPQVVWRSIKILLTARPFDYKYLSYVMEFLAGVFGIGLLTWSLWKTRLSWAVFSIMAALLPTLTGTFSSLPRYLLPCLSIYVILAKLLGSNKYATAIYIVVSSILLMISTMLFIQGYWVA